MFTTMHSIVDELDDDSKYILFRCAGELLIKVHILSEIQVFFISLLSSFLAESYDDIKIWGNVKQKFGPKIHIFYL